MFKMTSINLHNVEKINVGKITLLETTGAYSLTLYVHTNKEIIGLTLFSNIEENLKINQ